MANENLLLSRYGTDSLRFDKYLCIGIWVYTAECEGVVVVLYSCDILGIIVIKFQIPAVNGIKRVVAASL